MHANYASKELNVNDTSLRDEQQTRPEQDEQAKQVDKVRGPTVMRKIWKHKPSVRLPISKFDIPPTADSWILLSFECKMKNWRATLKDYYYDASVSMEVQLKSPPLELNKKHWRRLLEYWSRENVMEMSVKNKANMANKKLLQVMGKNHFAIIREELKASLGREPTRVDMFKKCFSNGSGEGEAARAIEQMKELTEKLGDGATDAPGPDDVYAKIMGQHKYGSAETYGLGVHAKDLWGAPGRSAIHKENAQMKAEKAELVDENVRIKAQLAEKQNGSGVQNIDSVVHSSGVQRLKVTRGWLRSLDPRMVVLGIEIGPDWYEVEVQVSINKDEALFRPHDHLVYIHDVIGPNWGCDTIAWPTALIEMVRDD
ncbi:uncharacterized protein [Rutidosis leptorrhynchoides]|uniref:uncharacterized protein n=1 Tax=Rutidosis leptorrhynchoides TaxID=125765 RepID=UPI003A98FF72